MGTFVLVWGDIVMPRGAVKNWSASTVDLRTWGDAKAPFAGKERRKRAATLLAGWRNWNPTEGDDGDVRAEFLTIDDSDSIRVRGRIDEETFLEMAPLLAGLLRSSASFGGRGDVTFDAFATRLLIANGKSSFVKANGKALRRASDRAALAEIAAVGGRAPAATIDPSRAEVAVRRRVLAAVRGRVLAAVKVAERKKPDAIDLASTKFNYGVWLAPNLRLWPTGVLLQCLGVVMPDAVEPLARDFLACATDVNQRQRAFCALGLASTETAVDTLIETLLSPVPKSGAFKSDHLGANWGLRDTTFRGTSKKIAAAIAKLAKQPKRDADVASMLRDIRKLHAR